MNYELSFMVTSFKEDGVWVVYNWENGANISVDDKNHPLFKFLESGDNSIEEFLVNGGIDEFMFLVDNNFFVVDQEDVRQRVADAYNHANRLSDVSITLMPAATKCNFSCRYCSQDPTYDDMMGDDERSAVINFIKSQSPDTVRLDYFGGEPLLNVKFIVEINRSLIDLSVSHGFKFVGSSMTTNGYLLSGDVVADLLGCRVNSFQITIDGAKKFHDNYRKLRDGSGTFDVIYNNLRNLAKLDQRFLVTVRVNFTAESAADEERAEFTRMLSTDFGGDDRFLLMVQPVGNWKNELDKEQFYCDPRSAKEIQRQYEDEAERRGVNLLSAALYGDVESHHCYASKKNNFILYPFKQHAGRKGMAAQKCTFCGPGDVNEVGMLLPNGSLEYNENYEKWLNPGPFKENKCRSCHFVLSCYGCSCPLKNSISGSVVCPPEKSRPVEEVKRILSFIEKNV